MTILGRWRIPRRFDDILDRDPYLEGLARQLHRLKARTVRHPGPRL
ncbi:MAG: hypothetical protein ACT4N8_00390 [Sphingosinicella sp.]